MHNPPATTLPLPPNFTSREALKLPAPIVNITQVPDAFYTLPLPIEAMTDHYFNNTAAVAKTLSDSRVTYAVFLRTPSVVAVDLAIEFLRRNYPDNDLEVRKIYPEGREIPAGKKFVEVTGKHSLFSPLETLFLQYTGWACVSAYNALQSLTALPQVPFIAMEARHVPGWIANVLTSYGAAVASHVAQYRGCVGFIGASTGLAAPFFGTPKGLGTMPHALVGLVKAKRVLVTDGNPVDSEAPPPNTLLETAKAYVETMKTFDPTAKSLTVLADYDGREITDTLAVANWFFTESGLVAEGWSMGVRLDTHGGRYLEGLDWDKSVEVLKKWTHLGSPDEIIDAALEGIPVRLFNGKSPVDVARKHLFDTGVTAANIVAMRKALDDAGFKRDMVKIVGSSGFNALKCRIMANLKVPVDVVGTGSFIPEKTSEANATADIWRYDDVLTIKVGREYLAEG